MKLAHLATICRSNPNTGQEPKMANTTQPLPTPYAILLAAPSLAEGIERVLTEFPDLVAVDEILEAVHRARAARLTQMRGLPT